MKRTLPFLVIALLGLTGGRLTGQGAPDAVASAAAAGANPAPGPDVQAVLRRTIENTARDLELEREFKARYAYTRTKTTERFAADGDLLKRTIKVIEHQPGVPGKADTDDPDDEPDESKRKRAYERRDFEVTPALLDRFRFTYIGPATQDGRAVWVIDFEPRSRDLPAASLKERFINHTAGRLWIDQQDQVLARASFRLTEPLNVFGGLVGALRKCEVSLQRARTEAGLWYPREMIWHIEGRKLLWSTFMSHSDEIESVRPVGKNSS